MINKPSLTLIDEQSSHLRGHITNFHSRQVYIETPGQLYFCLQCDEIHTAMPPRHFWQLSSHYNYNNPRYHPSCIHTAHLMGWKPLCEPVCPRTTFTTPSDRPPCPPQSNGHRGQYTDAGFPSVVSSGVCAVFYVSCIHPSSCSFPSRYMPARTDSSPYASYLARWMKGPSQLPQDTISLSKGLRPRKLQ